MYMRIGYSAFCWWEADWEDRKGRGQKWEGS